MLDDQCSLKMPPSGGSFAVRSYLLLFSDLGELMFDRLNHNFEIEELSSTKSPASMQTTTPAAENVSGR